jgi:hypothetical protein
MVDNKVQPDPIVRLYNNIKNEYDLPDFNTFKADMSDSNKAKRLHATLINDGYEVPKFDVFSVDMGLKKKAGNLPSSGIPFQSQKQPDNFLQQGQKMASGEIFKTISASVPKSVAQPVVKTTLKDAALKDKENNNSYLGAMWNNVVSSAERLAGGAARLVQKFDTSPVARIQESVDKAASSVTGVNYEALREKETTDKIKNFIGKARTSSSSKEYEQGLAKGFDVTDGIGLDDIKSLGAILPSMLVDIGAGAATGGSSFAIQGYDDALSTIDSIPEAKNISETTRTAFGFGGAIISGVLEKLGMDGILKSGTATKYVTAKILKEAAGELAKKGVKVTAEQFEKTIANKATQMLTKTALKNTGKVIAKAGGKEAFTEFSQEGANDLMKLAANQIEKKKIFNEEELKNTAASRYLNAAAMGGIFGGGLGSLSSRTKNVQGHIENEIKNAKTQEDIDNLVNEINQGVEDGVISQNDAELFKLIVDENVSKPSSLDVKNEKELKLADIDSQIASLNKEDRLYTQNLDKLTKERNEIVSLYDNLSKKSKENEEIPFDDGKGIPSELIVDVSSIPKETTEPVKLPITEEIPEITVEGTRRGYEVIAGNEANSIGDIRQEAAERRSNGEKFFVKETEKDGKKIFTLVDTTVFDEFGRPGFKSASVTVPENARLSSEALMSKMKDALGVTDKTSLQELNKITSKMKEGEVEVAPIVEVKPTEVIKESKDLSKFSEAELEKRQLEIEDSKSDTPERSEFNNIDKELEKREWRKVFDSPLDKVSEVADELIKKDKEKRSGFGSYIEPWDARSLKLIAYKYSKENVKKLTDSEIIKDYKDAMFGNPTSWYSDGLRLRESVKEAQNRGIDVFKELSKEFVKDGYSEQDAMDMAKRKLEPILKDLKQSSEKPLQLEQKPKAEVKPTEVKTTKVKPKEEKTFAQKDLDRAEAKRIHARVSEMDPPSDAEQIALRYLAEGGKVSQDAINEVSGTTKRASLNTGRRELKTAEAKARDYASGNESLDDLAHRLWENSGQEISERDIKDALMSEIGNNNTRLDASKAYLERYNIEYQEEQYYERFIEEEVELHAKVQEELERDLRKPLEEETEGMSSEEHIDNLIKQYEAETKRENKQLRSEGKGEAVEEISSRDTRKKAPEKEELAKEYKEAVSKVSKKAKENAKKEFVERNFDSIVEKLKIQIKCPT